MFDVLQAIKLSSATVSDGALPKRYVGVCCCGHCVKIWAQFCQPIRQVYL